ncbi:MAG TPA: sodium:proton antiporter [Steroidobacteraceae bacterium]|jgi:NhaP-type Na+/H+ or K+/H+ antiporter|nr:sodium:proton antiporter [Steroidobacteraceae bacterium]
MAAFWFVLVGILLVAIALIGRFLDRLPVSPAMIYLVVGFALGPAALNVIELHPLRELPMLESITEIALLIALFSVGIKLRVPIGDWRWSLPLRLATVSMVITIAGIALVAGFVLGFEWPLALVLGAVLAPTDPVLASDVQLRSAQDRDNLRFGLTGEGGLNDGTAFPFVLLGLGAMGFHDLGWLGWRWITVDLVWGTAGGLGIGFMVGTALARSVRMLRAWRRDAVIFDEFLLLGVIALSYGLALAAHALGFLAVFAAGLALRRADDIEADSRRAVDKPPLTPSMLNVNEQLERIVEVAIVLLVGVMISTGYWSVAGLILAMMLFAVIRPAAVWLGVPDSVPGNAPRHLLAWFGIRGIGSVYYAVYFAGYELRDAVATDLLSAVFTAIAASIVLHGVSSAPLMELYRARRARARPVSPVSDKR